MDPLLIDGIAAFVLFALMAAQFVNTRHLQTGQGSTTVLTWLLAVLIVGRLLTKLQARDRTQLVVIAYETGLVERARGT
jgi:hypothetical protein